MAFVKAVREKVNAKVIFVSPSGGGKTMSMLEMAVGLAKKSGSRIAFIGTEGDRDKLYAEKKSPHGDYIYDYDLLQLTDYSPESYIAAIDEAIDAGYKVIVIDGLAHEWKYINDLHDKMPGNSFTNWGKLKPRHHKLNEKLLEAPAHILCSARGKDDWVLEEKNGKQVPKKVGLGSQTDKDITYEVMLSIQIDQDTHVAHADKDNTGLWGMDRYSVITAKDGEALYDWCDTGAVPEPKAPPIQKSEDIVSSEDVESIKKQITDVCNSIGGGQNKDLMAYVKEHGNYNGFTDVDKLKKYLEDVKKIKPIEE